MHMGREEVVKVVKIVLATVMIHELYLLCYNHVLQKHKKITAFSGQNIICQPYY